MPTPAELTAALPTLFPNTPGSELPSYVQALLTAHATPSELNQLANLLVNLACRLENQRDSIVRMQAEIDRVRAASEAISTIYVADNLSPAELLNILQDAHDGARPVASSASLMNNVARLVQMTMNQQETIGHLRDDLEIIGRELRVEAERRDWCGEYLDFVERVNDLTSEPVLVGPMRSFSVSHTYEVTIHAVVQATSQDAAQDAAREQYAELREAEFFIQPTGSGHESPVSEIDSVAWHHQGSHVGNEVV